MMRLEILGLQIEDERWRANVALELRREFESSKLILPTVRTLVFSRHFEWLVFKCPNVLRIKTKDRWLDSAFFYSLIKIAASVQTLENFQVDAWQDEQRVLGTSALYVARCLVLILTNHSSCCGDAELKALENAWRLHVQ